MKPPLTAWSLLRLYPRKVFLVCLAMGATAALGLAFPWALKIVVDDVIVRGDLRLLHRVAGVLIAVSCAKFIIGYFREYLVAYVGEHVTAQLRMRLSWHLNRLSVSYTDRVSAGRVMSGIIGDIDTVRMFLFGGCVDTAYAALDLVFVALMLVYLDLRLALLSAALLPVCYAAFVRLNPLLKSRHAAVRERYALLTSRLEEVFGGMRVIAGFGREREEAAAFSAQQRELVKASMATHTLGMATWLGSEFIAALGLVILIWLGSRAVMQGKISAGELMAFYSYLGMLFFPVVKLSSINNHYQEARASMDRINAFLKEEPRVREAVQPVLLDSLSGAVEARNVDFGYEAGRRVLKGISFKVRAGATVALVGKSGAGKTTVVNLIARFYDPDRGTILIDGHDLRTLSLQSFRSRIAMVLQDDYLFDASVRENVLYGNPAASEKELRSCCAQARCHEFIEMLPDGYDTLVGPRGMKLSYGQRQRLSIARALVRDPRILLLDEATSNVDSETERAIIIEAYRNLAQGRTTFMIAHRLWTVTQADTIFFLEHGSIVEQGTHEELLRRQGRYCALWRQQNESMLIAKDAAC